MSLDDIQARRMKAHEEIARMCKEAWAGRNPWRWSIPANPDKDSDLILSLPLADNAKMAAALDAVQRIISEAEEAHRIAQEGSPTKLLAYPMIDTTDLQDAITEALG